MCVFWLPSLVEAAISLTRPETASRGWGQDSPSSLVLHKPQQSLCHLRLPLSISHKHWRPRRVLQTSSHHAKSWSSSEMFKPICGWSSNTLVFSSLTVSSLKAELVMVGKSLATKETRPSSSLTTPALQEMAKPKIPSFHLNSVLVKLQQASESPGTLSATDCWTPIPEFLIRWVGGRAQEFASLISTREMLTLLMCGPQFKNQCPNVWSAIPKLSSC